MASVVIGLGTNVGDRFDNLARALDALQHRIGTLTGLSRVYATAPVGFTDQPMFWNAVACFDSPLDAAAVLAQVGQIEREVGRVPTFAGGPRVIDLDVLLVDDDVVRSDTLTVPHPRMHERAFVLRPLAELAADRSHPVLKRTVRELLHDVAAQHAVPLAAESDRLRVRVQLPQEHG